ncbi:hypothetical protein [Halalkalibaculum sp. DA384]|uniref:hypothetical protein n=1 Tax=Halalkalibaculum sp. DA384 TaxID=3373606 RepID=UPI0037545DFF
MAANDTQTVHVQTLFSYALQPYRFDISAPQKLRIEPHSTQPFAYVVYGNGNQGDQLTIIITDTAAQSSHLEKKLVVDFTEPIDVIKRPVMADLDEPAVLIEQETSRSYELNAGRKTEITPGAQTTSYVLVIGNDRYIEDQQKQYLPSKIEVSPNYPNPFNPATTLSFTLPRQNMVSLKVYDVIGRNIATLIEEVCPAGVY